MSRITHHPQDETLAAYAAGSLPAALAMVVGCHLQYCTACTGRVAQAEAMGGSLLSSDIAPQALSSGRRDSMLAMLDSSAPDLVAPPRKVVEPEGDIPRLLQPLVAAKNFRDLPWKNILPGVPGMRHLPLNCGEGNLRLLFIGAGMKMPVHSHRGNELTLVLQGGYHDALGQFNAGDFADLDGSVQHQPIAFDDEDCICLGGLDDRLAFRGWIARLLQPFVGL